MNTFSKYTEIRCYSWHGNSLLVAIFIAITVLSSVQAQNSNECLPLLAPDITEVMMDEKIRLSYLSILDRFQYEKLRENAEGGATFPVNGFPITGDMSYEKFEENLRKEKEKVEYNLSVDKHYSFFMSKIPIEARKAYVDCIKVKKGDFGPEMTVESATNRTALIKLSWREPPNFSGPADILTYGIKNIPTTLQSPANDSFTTKFPVELADDEQLVIVNIGGYSAHVTIPGVKPKYKVRSVLVGADKQYEFSVHQTGDNSFGSKTKHKIVAEVVTEGKSAKLKIFFSVKEVNGDSEMNMQEPYIIDLGTFPSAAKISASLKSNPEEFTLERGGDMGESYRAPAEKTGVIIDEWGYTGNRETPNWKAIVKTNRITLLISEPVK